MKIDYFKMIRESAEFSWKYKRLWLFGFLLALTSGGSSSSSNINLPTDIRVDEGAPEIESLRDRIENIVSSPAFWLVVGIIVLISIVLIVVFWYLSRVAKVSLMRSVLYDENNETSKIRISSLWKKSHSFMLQYFKYDLAWLVLTLPFILVVGVFLLPMVIFGPVGILLFCCLGLPVVIVLLIIYGGVKMSGERYLILEGSSVSESIVKGWQLFRNNLGKIIVGWLVMLLPGFVFGMVFIMVSMILFLPLLGIIMAFFAGEQVILAIGISAVCGMGILLILKLIEAPYRVFTETYWTKVLRLFIQKAQ